MQIPAARKKLAGASRIPSAIGDPGRCLRRSAEHDDEFLRAVHADDELQFDVRRARRSRDERQRVREARGRGGAINRIVERRQDALPVQHREVQRRQQRGAAAARGFVVENDRAGLGDAPLGLGDAGVRLREYAMPAPFNRSGYGTVAGLESLCQEKVRAAWARRARPGGTVIGMAGNIEPERARDMMEGLLNGWSGTADEPAQTHLQHQQHARQQLLNHNVRQHLWQSY